MAARTLDLGTNGDGYRATVEITLTDEGVAVMGFVTYRGVEWVGGQCHDVIADLYSDSPRIRRFCKMWDRWHLNDTRAGCSHQERRYREDPAQRPTYLNGYRGSTGDAMGSDDGAACTECGYRYGTAWLKEDLPDEVRRYFEGWTPTKSST